MSKLALKNLRDRKKRMRRSEQIERFMIVSGESKTLSRGIAEAAADQRNVAHFVTKYVLDLQGKIKGH